jgi:uroporphyrinogen III methyltransferase/synthase
MGDGAVCFVGLGPGDPRLRTQRAADRIAGADVVIRDGEATPERLIALAREGKRVLRAVEGDALESPGVLAEALAVARAGVAIEVVPGVGARSAAAAFAGVLGRAVRVPSSELERAVAAEARDAPVTLIAAAGSPSQRVIATTAGEAVERARGLDSATVIVAFAAPDDALRWFEHTPLFGKRVLVTRAREQADGAAALFRECGAEPVVVPTIEIRPPSDPAPLARALADLRRGAYGWVAFTSANGVEHTLESLAASGGDARAFGAARLAAIGPATARALERHGLRPDVVAKEFRGEALGEEMLAAIRSGGASPRVLLARAARARDALPEALRAAGCAVDVVAAYETHAPPPETVQGLAHELAVGRIDIVTFTSSSTVDNLCDLLGSQAVELIGRARVGSIGPVTTETARARGVRVDVTARQYTVPGLVQALAESYR